MLALIKSAIVSGTNYYNLSSTADAPKSVKFFSKSLVNSSKIYVILIYLILLL